MRKLVASALLAGLVLLPAVQASAAAPRGGGGGSGMLSRLLGLAKIDPQAGSNVAGAAFLAYNAQEGKIDVTVEVTGLTPNTTHPAHIHLGGSCNANGPVIYPLPTLTANASGEAISTASIDARTIPAMGASGWYINVHLGPGLTGAQFTPIGCGTVRRADGVALLKAQAGSSVQGVALMALNPHTTDVVVLVTNLPPNSMHPEHIHMGNSCSANGPVIYPLPTLTANADGIAVSATNIATAKIPATGWYVNVHKGPGLTGAQFTPIGCGTVMRTM